MATVGAYVRVDPEVTASIRLRIDAIDGVSTFDVEDEDGAGDDAGKVGVLIEADSLSDAHEMLTGRLKEVEGVLAVWPVYANFEDEQEEFPIDPESGEPIPQQPDMCDDQ